MEYYVIPQKVTLIMTYAPYRLQRCPSPESGPDICSQIWTHVISVNHQSKCPEITRMKHLEMCDTQASRPRHSRLTSEMELIGFVLLDETLREQGWGRARCIESILKQTLTFRAFIACTGCGSFKELNRSK